MEDITERFRREECEKSAKTAWRNPAHPVVRMNFHFFQEFCGEKRISSPVHPKPLTDSKREFISNFITEFNLKTAEDIQNALRDLLGDTIKSMMGAEMTDHLGYEKSERSDSDNSRNGTKPKKVRSKFGEFSLDVPKDRNGRAPFFRAISL